MTYCLSIIRLPRLTGEPLFFTDRLPCGDVQVRLGPFMAFREKPRRMEPWVPQAEATPERAAKD